MFKILRAAVISAFAGFLAIAAPAAAQTTIKNINQLPAGATPSGSELIPVWQGSQTVKLTVAQIVATYSSASAPSSPYAYQLWLNTSSTPYVLEQWDGAQWVALGNLNATTHAWTVAASSVPTGKSVAASNSVLESLLPVQTVTGSSKTFATADIQLETRRSNSGSAMADTFPASSAAGMVAGARITVTNVDASATDTLTSGSGTLFSLNGSSSSTYPVEAGRAVSFIYDSGSALWRQVFNTGNGAVFPSTGSNVPGDLVTTASAYGKVQDSGIPLPSGRNLLINGAAAVDQRNVGASQTITSSLAYTIDRWYALCTGVNCSGQQESSPLTGFANAYKFTGVASNTGVKWGQRIESKNAARVASQNVAGEIELRSSSLTSITWTAYYATATDNFTSENQIATGTCAISASFSNCQFSFNASAFAGNGLDIVFSGGALLASQTLEWTGAQLESGSASTPLEHLSYSQQLLLCDRYAWAWHATSNYASFVAGQVISSGNVQGYAAFPVPMRTAPALSQSAAGTFWGQDYAGTVDSASASLSINNESATGAIIQFGSGDSVLTAGRYAQIFAGGTINAYAIFSSEL